MTKHIRGVAAVAVLLSAFTGSQLARAEESDSDADHRHSNFVFSISPQYFGINSDGYAGAFINNGFSAPKSGGVGIDFNCYGTLPTQWQLGFGFSVLTYSNDLGSSTAEYSQALFGLWLAKNLIVTDDFELSLGSYFNLGAARFEMLSATANGRTDENSFVLEPKLTATFKVSHWLAIGLSGAYLEPLGQSDTIKGQSLTPGNLTIHGAKGGVEFMIGRFGPETTPSK